MLEDMYRIAKEKDAAIVRCDFFSAYATHEEIMKQGNETNPKECVKLLLSEKIHGAFWNKLVRRTLFTDHKIVFFDGYWDDLRASVQLFHYAPKIAYIPKAYYHYVHYNVNSLSVQNHEQRLNEVIQNTDGIIEFLKEKNLRLDKHIHYLKLAAKQTLLFTCDKSAFRQWLQIYPESSPYIWSYPSLPFHLKMVGGFTALRLWPLVDLWIGLKKWHISKMKKRF